MHLLFPCFYSCISPHTMTHRLRICLRKKHPHSLEPVGKDWAQHSWTLWSRAMETTLFGVFGTCCETLGEFRSLEHNIPHLKHGKHNPYFSGWLSRPHKTLSCKSALRTAVAMNEARHLHLYSWLLLCKWIGCLMCGRIIVKFRGWTKVEE